MDAQSIAFNSANFALNLANLFVFLVILLSNSAMRFSALGLYSASYCAPAGLLYCSIFPLSLTILASIIGIFFSNLVIFSCIFSSVKPVEAEAISTY